MSSAFALIATLSPKSGAKLLIIFKLTNIFALFFQTIYNTLIFNRIIIAHYFKKSRNFAAL